MNKDFIDYVSDIFNAMKEIKEFTYGLNYKEFQEDKKTINAVIRSLEIMGKASKKIPEDLRIKYPDIPWKRMTGMRDKLIHEYSGVDLEIVWTVIKEELPPVESFVQKMLEDLEKEDKDSDI